MEGKLSFRLLQKRDIYFKKHFFIIRVSQNNLLTGTSWSVAGCRYEGRRYEEGTSVVTSEPCLQCRCNEGALRCRLRVCPRLPNPPPTGCTVRSPEENVCCAELVCSETRQYDYGKKKRFSCNLLIFNRIKEILFF